MAAGEPSSCEFRSSTFDGAPSVAIPSRHSKLTVSTTNSRQAIKKYVRANNKIATTSEAQFDAMFNKALKTGAEKGDFTQPKGRH